MDFSTLLAIPIILIVGGIIWDYIKTHLDAKKKYGMVVLKAKKDTSTRTLQFKKGTDYTFYKSGKMLFFQTETEHYAFYRKELENFEPIDLYGKLVLKEIEYIKY